MKKINQLKAGALISYVNILVSTIIPIVYTPIMLSILGKNEYGTYSLANSVISYLSLFSFGMTNSVVRFVTKYKCKNDKEGVEKVVGLFLLIFMCSMFLVLLTGGFMVIGAKTFFSSGLTNAEVEKLRILMVIMIASTALSFPAITFSSLVVAYERYIFRRIIELIGTILPPIINLIMLYNGWGSVGIASTGLLLQIIYCPVYIIYCLKVLGIKPRFKALPIELLMDIFSYTFFIFLSMIVDMLYWVTDKILIGAMIGTAAVAVYNVGGTFNAIVQNMTSAIGSVFVTRIMSMVEKNQPIKEISALLIRIGRLQFYIIALIVSGYIVFGKEFIGFWAGKGYADSYWIALLTMIPLSVPLIQNVAYNTIVAQNKHRFRAKLYAVIAIANVVSTALVIPRYGIIGAAICTCIAYVLGNVIIMNIYYYKVIGLDIPSFWKNIISIAIVPCILSAFFIVFVKRVWPIHNIKAFLIEVIVYTLTFGCMSLMTMNKYEKDLLIGLFKSIKIRK